MFALAGLTGGVLVQAALLLGFMEAMAFHTPNGQTCGAVVYTASADAGWSQTGTHVPAVQSLILFLIQFLIHHWCSRPIISGSLDFALLALIPRWQALLRNTPCSQ